MVLSLEFFFWGSKRALKEPKMAENEKVALSLGFLGTKTLLFEGPQKPGDCICTLFFGAPGDLRGAPGGQKATTASYSVKRPDR